MATRRKQPTMERIRTDSSLRAERKKTNDELTKTGGAEKKADEVVDRARHQSDQVLEAARAKADARLESAGASGETLAAAKAERAEDDVSLYVERRTADFLLSSEREQRQRAVASLLQVERGETDRHLFLERALLDERLARILAELAESVRVRDEFVSMASHELRTPLTPLAMRLQFLAREAARQSDSPFAHSVNSYIDTATRQITKLSGLVTELLDISRMTSGKLSLDLDSVDFGAVVSEVALRLGSRAEMAGCALELAAPSIKGQWDELLLDRLVSSLLDNAIKFGPGKPIRIQVQAVPGGARLTVQDGGIGISAEHISRIFGRFERAVSARNYGGLGLGLYTCRTIAEAMAGTVAVQSQPGQGSTFTVELPLSVPARSARSAQAQLV